MRRTRPPKRPGTRLTVLQSGQKKGQPGEAVLGAGRDLTLEGQLSRNRAAYSNANAVLAS